MKMPRSIHALIRGIIRLALIVIFVGIPAAALYFRQIGFNAAVREHIAHILRTKGIEMTMDRLTFDPFQGLIARGVTVRTANSSAQILTQVNHMGLSLKLQSLLSGHFELDSAFLRDTRVVLPLDDSNPAQTLELEDVDATVSFLPDQIRVTNFECSVGPLKIEAIGNLLNPAKFLMPKTDAKNPKSVNPLAKIVLDLRKIGEQISFAENDPLLEFQFQVDLADLSTLKVEDIRLHAAKIRYQTHFFPVATLEAHYESSQLHIRKLNIEDTHGELTVRGLFSFAENRLWFEASSTMDALPFFERPDADFLKKIQFKKMPEIALTGHLQWDKDWKVGGQVFGRLVASQISAYGVEPAGLDCEFTWKDGAVMTENFELNIKGQKLVADIYFAPDDFRLRLKSSLRPTDLLPWFDKNMRETIQRMEFADAPEIHVELSGTKPAFETLSGKGSLALGRTAMRGAWITSGKSTLEIGNLAVTFKNMEVAIGNSRGTSTFTYDFGEQEVRIADVKSQLPPYDILMWTSPDVAQTVLAYRFKAPPNVTLRGVVDLKGVEKNQMDITFDVPAGLLYKLLGRDLLFEKVKGRLLVRKQLLKLSIAQAVAYGGGLRMTADISLASKDPSYTADVTIDQCDFARLTKLYFDYDNSRGKVSGNYRFQTQISDASTMTGEGNILVQQGNVFAIPIFGPLSTIINQIIPGAGYESAKLASADFAVSQGMITTKNLAIESPAFSLYGNGNIYFLEDKLNMDIRINARGLPGVILFPVSKVLEYTSDGSFKNPKWRPKLIPKAIFGSGSKTR